MVVLVPWFTEPEKYKLEGYKLEGYKLERWQGKREPLQSARKPFIDPTKRRRPARRVPD
jgi:hypothetical protein